MNPIEKQAQLGRELFELNTDIVRTIVELSTENFRKYMELNQDYALSDSTSVQAVEKSLLVPLG